jgi:hypothetical protein
MTATATSGNKPKPLIFSRQPGRFDWAGLVIILAIAILLRFIWPDVVEFRQDEADLAHLAERMVNNREIPVLGIPSSAGIPNSPMTVYAILPPFFFTDDPVIVTLYVALVNIIGAILFWMLARRYFGSVVAFISGVAYAVGPWGVMYSRKLWAQNYHTPLILLGFLLAVHGFWENRRWAQVLALPILIVAMQIHFAAWALLPLYLLIMWTGRQNINWRAFGLSIVLCGVLLIPFGLGVNRLIAEQNTRIDQNREWTTRNIIKPAGQYLWLVTNTGLDQYYARAQSEAFIQQAMPVSIVWYALLPILGLGVIRLWRRHQPRVTWLILFWAFLTPVVLVLGAIPGGANLPFIDSATHYFVPIIPVICLLLGLGFIALADWLSSFLPGIAGQVVAGGLAAFIFVSQFATVIALLQFVDTTYTPTQFGFAPPLRYLLHVESRLPEDRLDVLILSGDDRVVRSDHGANVWRVLLGNQSHCVRELQPEMNALVQPSRPFTVMSAPFSSDLAAWNALYRQGSPTRLELRPDEGQYDLYRLEQPLVPDGFEITEIEPQLFTNNVALTGYGLGEERLYLRWRLPGATPANYNYGARFLAADGSSITGQSDVFWPGLNWCDHDILYTWLELPREAEAVSLGVAMGSLRPPAPVPLINGDLDVVIPLENGG